MSDSGIVVVHICFYSYTAVTVQTWRCHGNATSVFVCVCVRTHVCLGTCVMLVDSPSQLQPIMWACGVSLSFSLCTCATCMCRRLCISVLHVLVWWCVCFAMFKMTVV